MGPMVSSVSRTKWSLKDGALTALVVVLALAVLALRLTWDEAIGGQVFASSTVSLTATSAHIGQHGDLVSIVLLMGDNSRSVVQVTRAILATTVGPYELIVISTAPDQPDVSRYVVEAEVRNHQGSAVDRPGRGLVGFTSLNLTDPRVSDTGAAAEAAVIGFQHANSDYVVLVNGRDVMEEYGWDRILLTGLKSSDKLLAVSGRAAGNLNMDDASSVELTEVVGEPRSTSLDATASPEYLEVRDVCLRSPILYSKAKAAELNFMNADWERAGLGDVDMCLRGRKHHWSCAFYPVSVKTYQDWPIVPGTPLFDETFRLQGESQDMVDLAIGQQPQRSLDVRIPAIPRVLEDVPKTIVTAFSANHQKTAQGLYAGLRFSPFTRFVAYILPSDEEVDMSALESWGQAEVRVFDFSRWPDWMDIKTNRGEYAWKMLCVEEVMEDYGGLVLWQDAGNHIDGDLKSIWSQIALTGIWSTQTPGDIYKWTHPGMIAYFDVPQILWGASNCNGAMMGFNLQDARAMTRVTRPMIACSKERDCIAPPGSSRANHRQDQASLTILMRLHGYQCAPSRFPISEHHDAEGEGSKLCAGVDCR